MLRASIEMITELPPVMSPTIPAWTLPPRPVTGGKQPGKVPAVPPDLGASSDDSSSESDIESDREHSAPESESMVPSENDTKSRYRSIGRKTAQRRNSKAGAVGDKRLAGPNSENAKSSAGLSTECCCLLSSEQTKGLPRRFGDGILSKSPAVVRIRIPSFLLPTLEARLGALRNSKKIGKSATTNSAVGGLQLSTEASSVSKSKSTPKKDVSEDERGYIREKPSMTKKTKYMRTHSDVSDSSSDSNSDKSDVPVRRTKKSMSPVMERKSEKNGRTLMASKHKELRLKDEPKESTNKRSKNTHVDPTLARRTLVSGSLSPDDPPQKRQKKDLKEDSYDDTARNRRLPKTTEGRSGNDGHRDVRDKSAKYNPREYSKTRSHSRSRSRSRSPKRRNDKGDGRDGKSGKDRRDYDMDQVPLKAKRKQETSRERNDKSTKGRRHRSESRNKDRDNSRERSRDRKRRHSRSRSRSPSKSREGLDRKRDKEKRSRGSASLVITANTKGVEDSKNGDRLQQTQASKVPSDRKKSEGHRHSASDSRSQHESISKRTSDDVMDNSSSTSNPIKKLSLEHKGSNVDTPKGAMSSPALGLSNSTLARKETERSPTAARRMSIVPADANSAGYTKYYQDYRRYHALAVSLKRKADEITRIQNNPRLGAIVYFLSGNAFLRAFHFNDMHCEHLHSNRPEVILRESMKCWDSMKQFSTALSVQCHDKFSGLDGLSYLLEALVYYKCHAYSNYRLRQEMQAAEQFRKRPPLSQDASLSSLSSSSSSVMITTELAARLLQNAEDWMILTTKLAECEVALTPDIAREQFPETFKKWCIHPKDIGRFGGKAFSAVVELKQEDGTSKVVSKIQWPLGTYMHLGDLTDFAEEAVREYQVRNGLDYEALPMP
ncbi:hypothetical protein BGZ54_007001 [Gamsiella multidivaricata]|nr:hypothetical protein BGZ54_007001 [Gamsiella multidivaricata]